MKHVIACVTFACLLSSSAAFAATTKSESNKSSGGGMKLSLALRTGITGDAALSSPNFYGFGGVVEPTIGFNDTLAVGLRIDGMAMFGVNLSANNTQAGIRVLAGILPKIEYKLGHSFVRPMIGVAGGYYTVAITGASVSGNSDVGALAGGGRAAGIAPEIGIQFGGFRIAVLAHLIFGGQLEPVYSLELSGNSLKIKL